MKDRIIIDGISYVREIPRAKDFGQIGCTYYFCNARGFTVSTVDKEHPQDAFRKAIGNYYRTEDLCGAATESAICLEKLRGVAQRLNTGEFRSGMVFQYLRIYDLMKGTTGKLYLELVGSSSFSNQVKFSPGVTLSAILKHISHEEILHALGLWNHPEDKRRTND